MSSLTHASDLIKHRFEGRFSNVEILDVQIENSNVCIEVKQKKQEFGGAFMLVGKLRCNGVTEVDKNSTFKKGSF